MSRWIKPLPAAYLSPPATLLTTETASATLSGPVPLDVVVKIAPRDVLQDQVMATLIDASIVDRHDVRVLERFGASRLPQETLEQGRVPGERSRQNLEGDLVAASRRGPPGRPSSSRRCRAAAECDSSRSAGRACARFMDSARGSRLIHRELASKLDRSVMRPENAGHAHASLASSAMTSGFESPSSSDTQSSSGHTGRSSIRSLGVAIATLGQAARSGRSRRGS